MGIFADKCRALIDPETGRALSGEALKRARNEDESIFKRWPRCNNSVKKAAKFCNKCGSPAPKGWWKCPHCKKIVGNDSQYCWNCNAKLHPESRVNISGGVWNKEPTVFAQRFEVGDVKSMLKKDLQVQSGTMALLLDGGKFKGKIDAGRYDPDHFLRKLNHFGNPAPRSVVLVDAGDVILPVRVTQLRSSEGMALEFYGEIVLRFNPDQAPLFIENRMKDAAELSYEMLSDLLQGELRHAVDALCTTSTIDDLIRDPERRIRLQDELTSSLKVTLERSGLELVHVSSAEFCGDEYEELLEKQGRNEQKRREIEYEAQLRNMLSQETMEKFKSEQELKEYQELLGNEYRISTLQREREEKVLLDGWAHQDELESRQHEFQKQLEVAHHEMELESERVDHDLDIAQRRGDHGRLEKVKDAETGAHVRSIEFEQEKHETDQALEWRRKKVEIKQEERIAQAQIIAGKSMEELIALCEDATQREQLLRLHEQQLRAGISEREILAQAKLESVEEQKRLSEAGADRLERVMKEAIRAMGEASKNNGQTIIK